MDFPGNVVTPTHLHTWDLGAATTAARGAATTTPILIAWPSTNLAIYTPVVVRYPYPVNRVFWVNGTATSSNMDFGIYTPGGTRIYSTGSTAQSGASAAQYVTPSTKFVLSPGQYFFALSVSSTTANTLYGTTNPVIDYMRMSGFVQQASAVPLPATATFAAVANSAIPYCGVTRTTTGY